MCPHVQEPSLFCIQVLYVFVSHPVLRAHLFRHLFPKNLTLQRKWQQNVKSTGNKSFYLFLEVSNAVAQHSTPPSVTHHISAVV